MDLSMDGSLPVTESQHEIQFPALNRASSPLARMKDNLDRSVGPAARLLSSCLPLGLGYDSCRSRLLNIASQRRKRRDAILNEPRYSSQASRFIVIIAVIKNRNCRKSIEKSRSCIIWATMCCCILERRYTHDFPAATQLSDRKSYLAHTVEHLK